VEKIADSRSSRDYRRKVSDPESASMWQSLSFGANYKAAYCLAVCPAGEEVIGPFLTDRPEFSPAGREAFAGQGRDRVRGSGLRR
jgi:hypothetical protein